MTRHSGAEMVALAAKVAATAHFGQYDKKGEPYILHPMRVATRNFIAGVYGDMRTLRPLTPLEMSVALLHDVVEDTDLTLQYLSDLFGDEDLIAALDAITKREGEALEDYWARVKANDVARRIKQADISDNISRLGGLDEETRNRLRDKYSRALEALS